MAWKRYVPYHKRSVMKLWAEYLAATPPMTLKKWAYVNKVRLKEFVEGVRHHLPFDWDKYQQLIGDLPKGKCGSCQEEFIKNSAASKYCSDGCRNNAWGRTGPKAKKVASADAKENSTR